MLSHALLLAATTLAATGGMAPLPAGFAEKVENGWLPDLCVRQHNPDMPRPLIRSWSSPRAGEPIRGLFIVNSQNQYEALAIATASGLAVDIIPLWGSYSWRDNPADPDTMNLLRHFLATRTYDVVAMAGACLSALPDDCEEKIAAMVQSDGVGLVYALAGTIPRVPSMQGAPSAFLDPLLPLVVAKEGYRQETGRVKPVADHPLARGCAFSRMKWACNTHADLVPGATALLAAEDGERVLAAVVMRGQGRVVAYNRAYGEATYGYPFLPLHPAGTGSPFQPGPTEDATGKQGRWVEGIEYADQFYNWLAKAVCWAADRASSAVIEEVSVSARTARVRLACGPHAGDAAYVARCVVRAPYDTAQAVHEEPVRMQRSRGLALSVALPATGYVGPHMLDVFLLDSAGGVVDWASLEYAEPGSLDVSHVQDFALHEQQSDVRVPLAIALPPKTSRVLVRTEVLDTAGRLLVDTTDSFPPDPGAVTKVTPVIRLGGTAISSPLANVRITVEAAGQRREVRDQLFVHQRPAAEEFHIGAYFSFGRYAAPHEDVLAGVLRDLGHDTINISYPNPLKARLTAENGLLGSPLWFAAPGRTDLGNTRETVAWLEKLSPGFYEILDEPELQVTPAAERRFSGAADMERFRRVLLEKYGDLAGLNRAWGTAHGSWADVRRLLWHEVCASANWAPWFDSRRDLDHAFVGRYGTISDCVLEVAPAAVCSINPRSLATFGGTDLRELTRRLPGISLYTEFCAVAPMGYLHLGSRWPRVCRSMIGYTWPSSPGVAKLKHEAWDAVRHGATTISWFAPLCDESPPLGRFSFLNADLTPNARGRTIAEINRELASGPGQIAAASEPLREGILIYYPRTLFYTETLAHMRRQTDNDPKLVPATLRGLGPWKKQLPCSFVPHLRSLGYQFEFGDEKDLTPQRLRNTRVVLLSHVLCLGERELSLLRDFAASGGVVVAEAGTARRDGDGRAYRTTPDAFRELFGVTRPAPNLSPIPGREEFVAGDARQVSWISPLLGVAYQNGGAFLVNSLLPPSYQATMALKRILDEGEVRPTYGLHNNYIERDTSLLIASIAVRQRGPLAYIYVLGEGNRADSAFRIDLPEPAYVHEVTATGGLRLASRIEGHISYGEARLFAVSQSKPASFAAATDREAYAPGDRISLRFTLRPGDEQGAMGDRMIALDCRQDPGSSVSPQFPRTILLSHGTASLGTILPLNVPPGTVYEVVARDLASGLTCAASFESVRP